MSAAALAAAAALGVLFGSDHMSLREMITDPASPSRHIFNVRLPGVVLGALAGAGLAVVGAAFQALLKNPLAEPFVLGVSGGAALGATVAIAFSSLTAALLASLGFSVATSAVIGTSLVPAAALMGGLGATLLVYGIARRSEQGSEGTSILLAGVMVNAIAASLVTFLKVFVPPSRAQQLLRWLTGFLDAPTPAALVATAIYVGVGSAVLLSDAARMNLLALGEETAGTLGVDVRALTRRTFFACSCIVGGIVSITGLIGFVGLVVPHALRRLIGPDHRALLPASMLAGGAMVLLCDLLSRLCMRWSGELPPVGAVTGLIGGPLFLVMLSRGSRRP